MLLALLLAKARRQGQGAETRTRRRRERTESLSRTRPRARDARGVGSREGEGEGLERAAKEAKEAAGRSVARRRRRKRRKRRRRHLVAREGRGGGERRRTTTGRIRRAETVVAGLLRLLWSSSSSGDYSAYLPARNANGAYDRECTICRYILHVSGVACACNPDRPACLRHSAELCDCPNAKRVMFYRKSVARLERMCREVERHAGCEKQKSSEKAQNQKDAAATKARVKRAAAWVREAFSLTAAASARPRADIAAPLEPEGVSDEGSNPLAELERLAVAAEEFTWAGEEMDETRAVAAKVHVAVAFQKELAVLKRASPPPRKSRAPTKTSGRSGPPSPRARWTTPTSSSPPPPARPCASAAAGSRRDGDGTGSRRAPPRGGKAGASEAPSRRRGERNRRKRRRGRGTDGVPEEGARRGEGGGDGAGVSGAFSRRRPRRRLRRRPRQTRCRRRARRMALVRLRRPVDAAPFPSRRRGLGGVRRGAPRG